MKSKTKKRNKTILVIEDEYPLLEAIRTKLLRNNFEVICCRDAEDAMQCVADTPDIDLVWLDHYLSGDETGIDFLEKFKRSYPEKSIPVIIVSVSTDETKYKRYLELGVKKFFTKSNFGLQEIIDEICSDFNKDCK
jgi:DNA-binding response OmpR family regulator